jgi:spore coat protein H
MHPPRGHLQMNLADRRRSSLLLVIGALFLGRHGTHGAESVDPSIHLFSDLVPRIELQLDRTAENSLRRDPRTYVLGTVVEGGIRYTNVSIKIKGAVGSFRSYDDRPALTLNFHRAAKGQLFHGLEKIHLNNSVQDSTLMDEMICGDLFLAAGIPTARATHAVVQLNHRKLGLYVLKEGYDKVFLKRNFKNPRGDLYDGGFLTDIDAPLQKDEGGEPDDRRDLAALTSAAYERNLDRRRERLEALLDVDRFLSFAAIEMFTCDWDGYVQKANNYRLYFDPDSGKAVFIPHGMDQMFWWSEYPLVPDGGGLVARQFLQVPDFRERYFQRIESLMTNVFTAERLTNSVNRIVARLHANLSRDYPQLEDSVSLQKSSVQRRLLDRLRSVQEEIATLPRPVKYDSDGSAVITGWQARNDSGAATLYKVTGSDRPDQLLISVSAGRTIASWRARTHLEPGRYRFLARVDTRGVEPVTGNLGAGAGLRLSGMSQSETSQVSGTVKNKELVFDFAIESSRDVEFIAELCASKGEALFELNSLRLLKRN